MKHIVINSICMDSTQGRVEEKRTETIYSLVLHTCTPLHTLVSANALPCLSVSWVIYTWLLCGLPILGVTIGLLQVFQLHVIMDPEVRWLEVFRTWLCRSALLVGWLITPAKEKVFTAL